jgi:hypothetical protein
MKLIMDHFEQQIGLLMRSSNEELSKLRPNLLTVRDFSASATTWVSIYTQQVRCHHHTTFIVAAKLLESPWIIGRQCYNIFSKPAASPH